VCVEQFTYVFFVDENSTKGEMVYTISTWRIHLTVRPSRAGIVNVQVEQRHRGKEPGQLRERAPPQSLHANI